ncbi:hypothetical protein [Streptomyces ipomoeae]|uniref:hypothetical protein n=1 Tax=Streptomyces ipomoeae TaxID=103232 RepID=UPI003DA6EF90
MMGGEPPAGRQLTIIGWAPDEAVDTTDDDQQLNTRQGNRHDRQRPTAQHPTGRQAAITG